MLDVLECFHAVAMVYNNPIAKIVVMSMYRPSADENARFRTEVSIKTGVSAERVSSTLIGRYSQTQALQI